MRRVASLVAVTVAACVACVESKSATADSAAAPSVRAAVESTTAAFHEALRNNDSASLYSFVDDNVVMIPPGEPPVQGIAAMHKWYAAFLGQYHTSSLTLKDKEVFVGDGWATEIGTYEWGLQPTAGGAGAVDRGHYMQVWKQTPDGRWKFYRELWNSAG
jgi:ketosteroid isomerase-like protein